MVEPLYPVPFEVIPTEGASISLCRAGDSLTSLYIHDDRIGPYRRAEFLSHDEIHQLERWCPGAFKDTPFVARIRLHSHTSTPLYECWAVRYILLPLHPRIRIGLSDLDRWATYICKEEVVPIMSALGGLGDKLSAQEKFAPQVTVDYWIERGHDYQTRVLREHRFTAKAITTIVDRVGFPRHVGVIRFRIGDDDANIVDLLCDTTSSVPNEDFILTIGTPSSIAPTIALVLAETLQCLDETGV
jgi:hypothetical protein